MRKKHLIFAFLLTFVLFLIFFHQELINYYEVKQTEIYVKDANEYFMERMAADEQYRLSMTTEEKKTKEERFKRFAKIMSSRAVDIEFFGKVVDQFEQPISGVTIEFYGSGGYLVEGSGFNQVRTDDKGFFHITNSKGTSLAIKKLYKQGYEIKATKEAQGIDFESHQRYPNSLLFESHSQKSNPFIFKAWKLQEKKVNLNRRGYADTFSIDGENYWVDFTLKGVTQNLNQKPDALRVQFSQDGDNINLNLNMLGGGLLETEDTQYMNLAPESGYLEEYNYTFNGKERGNRQYIKYFYFKTGSSGFYGTVKMDIMPNFNSFENGFIGFDFVTNLEHSRILR